MYSTLGSEWAAWAARSRTWAAASRGPFPGEAGWAGGACAGMRSSHSDKSRLLTVPQVYWRSASAFADLVVQQALARLDQRQGDQPAQPPVAQAQLAGLAEAVGGVLVALLLQGHQP